MTTHPLSAAEQRARLIAYHDTVACSPWCHDDVSTYPIPPDNWEAPR